MSACFYWDTLGRLSFCRMAEELCPWSFAVAFNDLRRLVRPRTPPPPPPPPPFGWMMNPPPPPFMAVPALQVEQIMALNLSIKDQVGVELGMREQQQQQGGGNKGGPIAPVKRHAASTSAAAAGSSKVQKVEKLKSRRQMERDIDRVDKQIEKMETKLKQLAAKKQELIAAIEKEETNGAEMVEPQKQILYQHLTS